MHSKNQPNSLKGRTILVGPNDIAGFTSRIATALAGVEAKVLFFNAQDHRFNPQLEVFEGLRRLFPREIGFASRLGNKGAVLRALGRALLFCCKILAFGIGVVRADLWVLVGGKGFFGTSLEYAVLRGLGKRVVHVFVGSASRPRYLSGYSKEVLKDGQVDSKELKRMAQRTRRQARRIQGISRWASVVVENPLCGHFHEKPFVNLFKLGIPMDVAALEKKPRFTEATPPRAEGMIRILHCPSRPEIKGSAYIQRAIERLVQEGIPIEFRSVTGIPHAQVLHELTLCDFVVDQLFSDSPMAGFAAEAAAFGKAAIVGGYGWNLFREWLQPEEMPPTATCHPAVLEATIRKLALDPALREKCGGSSREFLQSRWSGDAFAMRFAQIVAGEIPSEWLVRPEQVRYLHGLGLEENETRRLVGALVEQFGPESLQVNHVPALRERLVSFATGTGPFRDSSPDDRSAS